METRSWRVIASLALVIALAGDAGAAEAPEEIVRKADLVRGPDRPFTMKMAVTDRKGQEVINKTSVIVNIFDPSRSLVEFVFPNKDVGRKLLKVDENMWIRIPTSHRAIRITPQQRLVGQASNGDILSTNYHNDYSATLVGEEEVALPNGAKVKCYKLDLRKKTTSATYSRLLYWVEEKSYRPVKSEFYTETGKLIKSLLFQSYGQFVGVWRPNQIKIVNAIELTENTTIDISQYGDSSLPVSYYSESSVSQ